MNNTFSQSDTCLSWDDQGVQQTARWRSERGLPAPKRIVLADDTLTADSAYRLACEGASLLWQSDFQNAKQLLQALARRVDNKPARKKRSNGTARAVELSGADLFNQHRLSQSQRARILGSLLIPFEADYSIPLNRSPQAQEACEQVWGPPQLEQGRFVVTLREFLGILGAFEWRKHGVEVAALGEAPINKIHPHYGVFSPVRGEYVDLVSKCPLPVVAQHGADAFDIGTGSGVLAAVLAIRGVKRVIATDTDARALTCAQENIQRLNLIDVVHIEKTDLFPHGKAGLVVCNPPWLPARPASALERAVYDENSAMLKGFLSGLAAHLLADGEGWLILSDLAEHLGLRSREELLGWISNAGLKVIERLDIQPRHGKVFNEKDLLHAARSAEVTSLWRLAPA